MLTILFILLLLPTAPPAEPSRVPVVVELFTSEGCSSCPPADALLRELETRQPLANVEIIPLGFHVDYWDELGWKDRFSSPAYTRRQEGYAARFGLQSAYTPQMVVDGRLEMVGNDRERVLATLRRQGGAKPARVDLRRADDNLEVQVSGVEPGASVLLAITETGLSTYVGGGENNGRQLRHTGVVRFLKALGSTTGSEFRAGVPVALDKSWRPENLHAVVFVQQRTGGIVGAASLSLR